MTDETAEWTDDPLSFDEIRDGIRTDSFRVGFLIPPRGLTDSDNLRGSAHAIVTTFDHAFSGAIATLDPQGQRFHPVHPLNWQKQQPLFTKMAQAIATASNQERFR